MVVVVERAPGAGLTVGRAIGTQLRPADIAPSEWLVFRGTSLLGALLALFEILSSPANQGRLPKQTMIRFPANSPTNKQPDGPVLSVVLLVVLSLGQSCAQQLSTLLPEAEV